MPPTRLASSHLVLVRRGCDEDDHPHRESATIDWDVKETVRAAMRAKVRRLLNRYGYPPDGQERAVRLVIEQAELFARAA